MQQKNRLLAGLLLACLFCTHALAQDFEDELEAELEAELGTAEEVTSEESAQNPAPKSAPAEEFSDENLDAAFDEPASGDESFDFSDFEEESQQAAEPQTPPSPPADLQNPDELELEPLDEMPADLNEPPIEEFPAPSESAPEIVTPSVPVPSESFADSGASDQPNLDLEARLYNIYVNFHNTPTEEGQWLNMIGSMKSEIYRIQKGDTLWGISEVLFGDGQFWPKIWSVNNKIENPHLIKEGNQIQFVMGTESDAPMFTVSETGGAKTSSSTADIDMDTINQLIESGALDAADAQQLKQVVSAKPPETPAPTPTGAETSPGYVEPDIEIPPPSVISRPVLRQLPPSVPEWQNSNPRGDYDDVGIYYARRPIADLKDQIYLSSYIDDKPILSEATVFEMETGSQIAWELQYVYVKFPKDKAASGEKYLVVQDLGALDRANKYVDSSKLGYQKLISGMVTLGDKVKADVDSKKYDVYRAFVDKAIHPVRIGGQLVRGELPMVDLSDKGPRSDVVAQIIGGSLDKRRQVFGKTSIVFINRGLEDGVMEGQVMPVRANRYIRNQKSQVNDNARVIGSLKIVKVANQFATGVIIDSTEDILAGDVTGAGKLLPRLVQDKLAPGADEEFVEESAAAEEAPSDDADLDQMLEEESPEINDFEGQGDFE